MAEQTKQKQRKRFKRPRKPKESKPLPKKTKVIKKEKTCHQVHGGRCPIHDLPCNIIVQYPEGDSRNHWRKQLEAMGAERHDADSEHRCAECEKERVENSPFKELEVEGLDQAQIARFKREAQEWTNRFVKKADD